ncbi:MAG: ubiquitin-like small modifier protein 1 [Candidatus Nezhaarchaeales archaeon]|nr:MAG: molybdopterin synthase sulfur carrier subunit [Candidatus Nezhaarchaeota archaeon WYZ-LMO8]TDA35636.1 MAG: molybdopterin synthase sulfur carrier subunit [Candidatus Nezhaarchaeota archaeon WYZ-LMO7]
MKVKVKFFALIREVTGVKEVEEEVEDGVTVRKLLEKLCEKMPKKFQNFIFNGREVSKNLIILVNRKGIRELDGLETKLKDGDEVALLPPVSGG